MINTANLNNYISTPNKTKDELISEFNDELKVLKDDDESTRLKKLATQAVFSNISDITYASNNELKSSFNIKEIFGFNHISGEVSLIGKAMGFDKNFDDKESNNLMEFIKNSSPNKELVFDRRAENLLDSTMPIKEFKEKWLDLMEIIKGEYEERKAQNTNSQENNAKDKFKPIQAVSKSTTYKDEATSEIRKIYEIIKREFDLGKNTFDILKEIAQSGIDKLA
ncbi:hypothetical protein CPIN17260_0902 [Campylobacter pinnipediorum subsp. pinnipediorum]|uniref:hypothetical protein n=1 Tax=Campylobacter pinnipediorum TaxID=1965231 RepID=UPI00084DDC7B|nr:hypothetical protein [Campylobacter pinnipediorum]AQW81202.1 hypothetical protein CPIN17260_0902 [Campylobacter pinnipediorum subsp. pinnipediorum]AQW84506.1 hypothetical protein CPIN17262_0822 [Campylobacter pinnipediorum subsp. pinnipediorum]